jgi:hypothetical protein
VRELVAVVPRSNSQLKEGAMADTPAILSLSVLERGSEAVGAASCCSWRAANLVVEGGGESGGDVAAWGGTERFVLAVEGEGDGDELA